MPGNNLRFVQPFKGKTYPSNPPATTHAAWWYRADDVNVITGNVITMYDKGPIGNDLSISGGTVTLLSNDINGKPSVHFNVNGGGTPTLNSTTPYFDPSQPFSWTRVFKSFTLTSGNYDALYTVAGTTAALSSSLFLYNNGTNVELYLQEGTGTAQIVTDAVDSTYTNYATYTIVYNGSGFSNPANFQLLVNGVPSTVTTTSGAGTDAALNKILGGSTRTSGTNQQNLAEDIFYTNYALTSTEITALNNYYLGRYNL